MPTPIICERCGKEEAFYECSICGRIICNKCGDHFQPDDEDYCYDCLIELENQEHIMTDYQYGYDF